MPVICFEQPPPDGKAFVDLSSPPKTALHDVKSTSTLVQDVEPTLPNAYPVVTLDVDVISEATASRLAASLLGHVLFLKNQIPFPVMQLGRIPGGKSTNSRAAKLRTELMASYDTISSHLDTTFSALATALARCSVPEAQSSVAQAHVAILVGPSLGTAKAKVIMGIDGLEKRLWGMGNAPTGSENAEEEDEEEADEDEDAEDVESAEEGEELPEDSDDDAEEEEEEEDESEDEGQEDEDEESGGENEEEGDEEDDHQDDLIPPPPSLSYAEEQKFLQSADRLLSRVLAAADAEGNGIASEMSPTQTHILIRAPRIFKHPAWIPRQNVSNSLDATLSDFLSASGVHCSSNLPAPTTKQSSAKKNKVEGVWLTMRGGLRTSPLSRAGNIPDQQQDKVKKDGKVHLPTVTDEEAEMIWWSWDGKFVGFSDW